MSYTVTVIGSGTMGVSIAQLLVCSPVVTRVNLVTRPNKAENSFSLIDSFLKKRVRKGNLPPEYLARIHDRLYLLTNYDSINDSDFLIEAITEDSNTKKDLFREISSQTSDRCVIASNTSSLSITELSISYKHPNKFIGMHFFNPATVMELNEIIVGFTTDDETLNRTIEFSKQLGKSPIMVTESPGFVVNRMLIPMINEAVSILAEGVATAEDIDKAMKLGAHHPMGPLTLADFIGNDVNLSIMETLFTETGDPKYRPHSLLRKMVRANFLGRKTKQGFFKY